MIFIYSIKKNNLSGKKYAHSSIIYFFLITGVLMRLFLVSKFSELGLTISRYKTVFFGIVAFTIAFFVVILNLQ